MRITNHMVTSNSLRNMQKSMQKVSDLNQQATTGKKISTPSEDPVVAIRALKLRTTCEQLDQYKNKNIEDALSWMGTTQTSIQNVYDRLQDVYYYCEQGASDTFQTKDRETIINELYALKEAIYREGGTTYAGRYLFSGYKTETNLIFQDDAAKKGLSYNITEDISPEKVIPKEVVIHETSPEQLDTILAGGDYKKPEADSVYQLRLAYNNLDKKNLSIEVTNADGSKQTINYKTMNVADSADYYNVRPGDVHYIPETGELILGEAIYESIKDAKNISVNYDKSEFAVGDLRPEMYFNCTQHKKMEDGTVKDTQYTVSEEGQNIQYEVNFKQYITVNAEGKDLIVHDMGNKIEDLARAVRDVLDIEKNVNRLKEMKSDPKYKNNQDAIAQIDKMLEGADVELALKRENMQKLFGKNMTNFQNFMEDVSAVQAKVGTTYSKLEMIQVRVTEQLANFQDLKSSNEDVETEEIAIELYQSELVYETALSTTASVIKKTLLDYL